MMPMDMCRWTIENFEGRFYTEDPIDHGGATKYGITLNTLSRYDCKSNWRHDFIHYTW